MSTSDVRVDWVTQESEAKAFASDVSESGATVLETKGWSPGPAEMEDYGDAMFEPLTVIGIIVATGWLIQRIADVLDDVEHKGGQLIYIGKDGVIVRPLPKVKPPGKLVIISSHGTQVFPPERKDEGLALLGTLLESANG